MSEILVVSMYWIKVNGRIGTMVPIKMDDFVVIKEDERETYRKQQREKYSKILGHKIELNLVTYEPPKLQ